MTTNETLFDKLQCSGRLNAGTFVSSTLIPELEVYGFIPLYNEDRIMFSTESLLGLDFNLTNTTIVCNRLVTVYQDCTTLAGQSKLECKRAVHPILKSVQLQENGKDVELPLKNLYIPQYVNAQAYRDFRKTVDTRRVADYKLCKLDRIEAKRNEEANETDYFYTPQENELLFFDDHACVIKAVGTDFCVVCRYLNQVTGAISYALFTPKDLTIIAKK